jgi:DNA-binding PadR family transcriptional regulator
MNHTLEKFLILKILHKYPNITRYKVMIIMAQLGFSLRVATFYSIIKYFKEENLVKYYIDKIPYKPIQECKSSSGWWNRKTKEVTLYSLTDKGHKELFRLEAKIKVALSLQLYGKEI